MVSEYEKAVAYDGDLLIAANEVLARVEEDTPAKEFVYWLRRIAREHQVSLRDLRARVLELAEW